MEMFQNKANYSYLTIIASRLDPTLKGKKCYERHH